MVASACCLLSSVDRVLLVGCWLLFAVWCSLCVVCCLLCVNRLFLVVCCVLWFACCGVLSLLFDAKSKLLVALSLLLRLLFVGVLLFVGCCLLIVLVV